MFCCQKKQKQVHPVNNFNEIEPLSILKKHSRRKSIYPGSNNDIIKENKIKLENDKKNREEFTEKFMGEIIKCGNCENKFTLRETSFEPCNSCDKFFHCGMAGACVGLSCCIEYEGKQESLKYCMGCVNQYLKINIIQNGQSLCKKCEVDPKIDKKYLEV